MLTRRAFALAGLIVGPIRHQVPPGVHARPRRKPRPAWRWRTVTRTFASNVNIVTPGTTPPLGEPGPANPYPSTITVSGFQRSRIKKVTVRLSGLTHTWPGDLDILLVAPKNRPVLLLENAGGREDVNGIDLIFSQTSLAVVSDPLVSGTYQPAKFVGPIADSFLPPAPAGIRGRMLGELRKSNPNGIWKLFIIDQGANDTGTLNGWSLRITVETRVRVKPKRRARRPR